MRRDNIFPNDFTFPCLFKASASLNSPFLGQQLHGLAVKLKLIYDVFVACSAFDMYSKTRMNQDANKVFDRMSRRNIATWNAKISNAVTNGRPREAIVNFIELLQSGEEAPNSITFCAFFNACADCLNLKLGQQLHGFVIRFGCENEVALLNGLIDFYGKCKEVEFAEMIFNGMRERNIVSWCSMLAVYEQNNMGEKACQLFVETRKKGMGPTDFLVSSVISACAGLARLELGRAVHGIAVKGCIEGNLFVGSALVDMYGKCGCIEDCELAFYEMPERNLICWNALIGGYAHQGHAERALELSEEMTRESSRMMPNYVTFVSVLTACSRGGMVNQGVDFFESMRGKYGILPGAEHYACVVDMLGRAGLVDRAYEFVKNMPMQPTVSIWGALLGACKVYGRPDIGKIAAEKLFELDPNDSGNHVILSNMFAAAGR